MDILLIIMVGTETLKKINAKQSFSNLKLGPPSVYKE